MRVVMASVAPVRGGAASLSTPGSAQGVLALQRALIENWLHLAFIIGEDDMSDAPCRALRMEPGWAASTHQLVPAATDQARVSEAAARLPGLTRLLTERSCSARCTRLPRHRQSDQRSGGSMRAGTGYLPVQSMRAHAGPRVH